MGFWQTGYMEFREVTGDGPNNQVEPKPAAFVCSKCRIEFSSERDLRVHSFEGHAVRRPVLVFRGRECGRSRLTITTATSAHDWEIRSSNIVEVNDVQMSADSAIELLTAQRSGIVDVTLVNSEVVKKSQFEFALAEEDDLDGVDAALARLIDARELSAQAVDDFIMRAMGYRSAERYASGLAFYLYGVLAREELAESGVSGRHGKSEEYESKYDKAVGILGTFDRVPAEAICGIVAFHYNQFQRAMARTKSQRVSEVSLRFQALLHGLPWRSAAIGDAAHPGLDSALSDSAIEQVLIWSALPLDGSAAADVTEALSQISGQLPRDMFKLHLVAAEHSYAAGDLTAASRHAEYLRHSRKAETWYADLQRRLQAQGASKT
ncbi:hypothetical protein [Pseudarthrobacter sp. NamE5]|uniref:hypothetical protein n=1 Tax=Pseudarthrobacter sp. NamE5 TaxID=2576839 RepID=UPI00110B05D7|nr:hypothetical protein [Pseudarthrobacter sp. NamE5]TLM86005.1 hypothetical protein FDW84_06930 [Pseudarthrobacter sp. NamE5]